MLTRLKKCPGRKALWVVPFVSLVIEKTEDLDAKFKGARSAATPR